VDPKSLPMLNLRTKGSLLWSKSTCSKCKSTRVNEGVGCVTCGSKNIKAGVKLRPKDMRDYFASTVQTDDPRVLMTLMRHTNLTTTTKYLRAMNDRMKDAVSNLGQA
jgi:integrase